MLNKDLIKYLREKHSDFIKSRRMLIKESGEILSLSKRAIFSFHRDDFEQGNIFIEKAEDCLSSIQKRFIEKDISLLQEGSLKAAQEEFIEAKFFSLALTEKDLGKIKDIEINYESYIGGLCDLTGELTRKSVNLAIAGDFKKVFYFKEFIEEIIGEIIQFDLTGYLRVKYDQAKNNLRKTEKICYDIKMREQR
ncbi:hypothetical protein KAI52_01920 [Candidatus Parcubacteria bacterium]|nr:hypothetical protein [Candidatus Parcubacteria bacterium]